ncbi:MAG: hypothetical protein EA401_14700 [Planctomycetota bacterium]|nr:MAG: hypothetical protein EA401_14700 [Planctomycetota bacterium]
MANNDANDPTDGSPKPVATFGQQIIIAVLVVAVGLLFGMGPVVAVLQQPSPGEIMAGISESEAARYQRTSERLQRVLNPEHRRDGEFFLPRHEDEAPVAQLLYARMAEREGLAPTAAQMDNYFRNWQRRTLPGSDTTYGAALAHAASGRNAVEPSAVVDFLRVRVAADAFRSRNITVPATSPALATAFTKAYMQQLSVRQVILDSQYLVDDEAIAAVDDEHRIEDTYHRLRDRHFATKANRTAHLYVADVAEIARHVAISDEMIEARYSAERDERFTTTVSVEDDDGEVQDVTQVQSLDDVRAILREELAEEAARDIAGILANTLRRTLQEEGLAGSTAVSPEDMAPIADLVRIDSDDDPRLESWVGLRVIRDVVIERPEDGTGVTSMGDIGGIDLGELNIFTDDFAPGFLSAPYRPHLEGGDRSASQAVILITAAEEAGYKPLAAVRDQVVRYIAARDQHQSLVSAATELMEQARAAGSIDAALAEDEALRQRWNIESTVERSLSALQALQPPAEDLEGPRPPHFFAVSLGAGIDPIQAVLADGQASGSGPWTERPRLRVLELTEVEPVEGAEQMVQWLGAQVQRSMEEELSLVFQRTLMTRIQEGR